MRWNFYSFPLDDFRRAKGLTPAAPFVRLEQERTA